MKINVIFDALGNIIGTWWQSETLTTQSAQATGDEVTVGLVVCNG